MNNGPNPTLKKLGFAEDDRVVIIHTDDIGMCQASVAAFGALDAFGLISSGAVMVPCPWFLEAAAYARRHPKADLGIHLTLTSEYATYRWRPLSTAYPASGLIDEEGFFPRTTKQVWERGDPQAVGCELEAQVDWAIRAGMQPTHFDTHMGAVATLKFIPAYLQLAWKYRTPIMMFRMGEDAWRRQGLDGETAILAARMVEQVEEMGLPLLDHIVGMDLSKPEHHMEQAKQAVDAFEPGITHFIIHPSVDTPELRAIAPDWRSRVAEYEIFRTEELNEYIKKSGIQVIGYRALRELMALGI